MQNECITNNHLPIRCLSYSTVNFSKITDRGWQFDHNNHFDGGTYLNEEYYEPVEVDFDEICEDVAHSAPILTLTTLYRRILLTARLSL